MEEQTGINPTITGVEASPLEEQTGRLG